MNNVKHQPSTR